MGVSSPITPTFSHNWRDERREEPDVSECGPLDTEPNRRAQNLVADSHHTFGSRPLYRRLEVMMQMPGEDVADTGDRDVPARWTASFEGYMHSQPAGEVDVRARTSARGWGHPRRRLRRRGRICGSEGPAFDVRPVSPARADAASPLADLLTAPLRSAPHRVVWNGWCADRR